MLGNKIEFGSLFGLVCDHFVRVLEPAAECGCLQAVGHCGAAPGLWGENQP